MPLGKWVRRCVRLVLPGASTEKIQSKLEITASLFVATTSRGEQRDWTLATRLSDMLMLAEQKYGPRDLSYTVVGVEFAGSEPMMWYPGDRGHIVIQLSLDCLNDLPRACYQLAHECIHLLAPTGKQNATNLEEGLATLYGEDYACQWFDWPRNMGDPKYEHVKDATVIALAKNPEFVLEIRRLKPSLNDFTPEEIVEHTGISLRDAQFLCAPFYSS
jgi:hypothetical protein